MSYQRQQSPKQQLSDFIGVFPKVAVVTAIAAVVMTLAYEPILSATGLIGWVTDFTGGQALMPFLVVSWVSLSLYITAYNMEAADEELEEEAEEVAEETVEGDETDQSVEETILKLHKAFSKLANLVLMIAVGGIASAYLTTTVAPGAGVVVAVIMPVMEIELSRSDIWFFSPSELLTVPTFFALIPLTLSVAIGLVIIGMVVALSQVLKNLIEVIVTSFVETLYIANVDTPALDPIFERFNRHGRR